MGRCRFRRSVLRSGSRTSDQCSGWTGWDCEGAMANDEWRTPPGFFRFATAMWGPFDLDVAATKENALCVRYYTKENNALMLDWVGRVWCNPPYSRILPWIRKAIFETRGPYCPIAVLLLPPNVDTEWFHLGAFHATTYLLRGRIQFMDPTGKNRLAPRDGNIVMTFPGTGQIQTLDWMSYRIIQPGVRSRGLRSRSRGSQSPGSRHAAEPPASSEPPVPSPCGSASTPQRSSGSPRTPQQD